nr:MAG: hypothetical protein [Microvirus sp.]
MATPYVSEIAGTDEIISVFTSVLIAIITLWKTIKKPKPTNNEQSI